MPPRKTTELHVATPDDAPVMDERQEGFLEWLLTPETFRAPATKQAYADQIGVHVTTLNRWEKLPHFMDRYRKQVQQGIATPERVAKLTDLMFEYATDPARRDQLKWAELWARTAGLMSNQAPPTDTPEEALAAMTDEELRGLVAGAAKVEIARRTQ